MAGVASLLAILAPDHAFREPGVFSLEACAGINLLLVTFLAGSWMLLTVEDLRRGWWPVTPGSLLVQTQAGFLLGLGCLVAGVIAVQFAAVAVRGDLGARDPLAEAPRSLVTAWFAMGLRSLLLLAVLLAWARLLRLALRRTGALLSLLVLVFTGFLLPDLARDHAALTPLVACLPDLGALSPLGATRDLSPLTTLGPIVPYGLAQALFVSATTALLVILLGARGKPLEGPAASP